MTGVASPGLGLELNGRGKRLAPILVGLSSYSSQSVKSPTKDEASTSTVEDTESEIHPSSRVICYGIDMHFPYNKVLPKIKQLTFLFCMS